MGRFLITLWYGEAYASAAEPLPYIAGGIVMMTMYVLLSRNFTSRNKQFVNIVAAYLALIGNLTLNVLLIPRYGITGAAMATTVSYSSAALLLLVFFLRDSGLSWYDVLIVNRSDVELWRRLATGLRSSLAPTKA
jgi:O-antigen/teichoic acid export membrane protein